MVTETVVARFGFAGSALGRLFQRRLPIAYLQLGFLFAIVGSRPFMKAVDPDFWWHLRTGELISESGIPRQDPFSWTAPGKDWVAHEWLSEIIIHLVEVTLGYVGNIVLFSVTTVAALGLMYALARRMGAGSKPLVLLMVPAAMTFFLFVAVRPQVFTWLLFAVFVYVLGRHYEGDRMPLWTLPALMALWVNLHLGFVYGLLVVGTWLLALLFARVRGSEVDLRMPVLVAGACLLATFLNPQGPAILWYPFRYLEDAEALRIVQEWQRPDFTSPSSAPLLATIVLLGLALISRSRPRPFLLLLTLAALALAFQALRNAPFATLLLLPVAGGALAGRWPAASRERDSRTMIRARTVAVVMAGLVAMLIIGATRTAQSQLSLDPNAESYPVEGAAYVVDRYPGARLFNDYNWGGYLIARAYPTVRVFVDGRTDFYGGKLIDDYAMIAWVQPGWDELLARYGVNVALVRHDSRLAAALRADGMWREAFVGPVESVFVRR